MIKIRRGKTASWTTCKVKLAEGQPGYDTTTHKLKIGDGQNLWGSLHDATGLFEEEILADESTQATSKTLFTYGSAKPTSSTKGKVYMQTFDGSIEADFVVEIGRDDQYFYRKWNSGFIECWGAADALSKAQKRLKPDGAVYNVKTTNYFELKGYYK